MHIIYISTPVLMASSVALLTHSLFELCNLLPLFFLLFLNFIQNNIFLIYTNVLQKIPIQLYLIFLIFVCYFDSLRILIICTIYISSIDIIFITHNKTLTYNLVKHTSTPLNNLEFLKTYIFYF